MKYFNTASAATLNAAEVKKLNAAGTEFSEGTTDFFHSGESSGTWVLSALCVTAAALGDHASETATKSPQVGRLTFQEDLSLWCRFELAPGKVTLEH